MKFFTLEELRQGRERLQEEVRQLTLALQDAHNEYAEAFNEGLEHGLELTKSQVKRLAAAEAVCKSCVEDEIEGKDYDRALLAAWKELAKDDEELSF
jgi:vacuolar-type H+-ATPase subunit C/Vma6